MTFSDFKQNILDYAQSGNCANFFAIISQSSDYNIKWNEIYHKKSGDTVIHLAAQSGCVDIIRFFYENGNQALLQQRNFDGKTPLHVAAQSSQLSSVSYLLSCNIDIDPLKRADWTPLMLACTKNNLEIVEMLLSHAANPLCKNKDGWTAFHIASREGNIDILQCLLKFDPQLWDTNSNNGRTPLHTAALHGHLSVIELVLSHIDCDKKLKILINAQDSCGTTPLMDAASGNHKAIIHYLIKDQKVNIEKTDMLGRNVLHLAAQSGSLDCILFLVNECGLDINQKTKDGLTPAHYAAKENKTECLKLLSDLKADFSEQDNKGRLAEEYGSRELISNLRNLALT